MNTDTIKQKADELLTWMEDHGSAPNRPSMAYGLLEMHLPVFLSAFADEIKNETIELCAAKIERIKPPFGDAGTARLCAGDIRSLKSNQP